MEIIHDVDRPDVDGVPPKMQAICDQTKEALAGMAPILQVTTNDNLMSSVMVRGSLDPKEDWANNIFENSRYFIFMLCPMKGKRYYDPEDPKITVETVNTKYNLPNLRKYTGPIDKAIGKIKSWLENNK